MINLVNYKYYPIWLNEKMLKKKIRKFIYYYKPKSLINIKIIGGFIDR